MTDPQEIINIKDNRSKTSMNFYEFVNEKGHCFNIYNNYEQKVQKPDNLVEWKYSKSQDKLPINHDIKVIHNKYNYLKISTLDELRKANVRFMRRNKIENSQKLNSTFIMNPEEEKVTNGLKSI